MKAAACLALGLALWSATGAAEDGLSARAEVLAYRYAADAWARSPLLRVAKVPAPSWVSALRPDLAWEGSSLSAVLRPRGEYSRATDTHSALWLNEGWLRWRPAAGLSVQAGREALLWGPATFWNPSNPFFQQNNKANPKREITGNDFLRSRWQIDTRWALTQISQLGHSARSSGAQRIDALKLDWVGGDGAVSALVSTTAGRTPGWQGWGQMTVSDALLVYAEMAWRTCSAGTLAQPAPGPTGWQLTDAPARRVAQAVFGASYTLENDWTLSAELWRNGAGLTGRAAAQQDEAVRSLSHQSSGLANAQLAGLIEAPDPLRRHYAGIQMANAETGNGRPLLWRLRYARNLDDRSGEFVVMAEQELDDQIKLWLNLMVRHGHDASEYGRWVRSASMAGLTWFAW